MNRESIWSGIFTVLDKLPEFEHHSRKLVLWDEVPAYPSIILNQTSETVTKSGRGLPNIYTMGAEIYVYIKNDTDSDAVPAMQINNLLDVVTNALLPPNPIDGKQTIGGLVHDAWIEGEIQRDEGAIGGYGIAVVPLKIMVSF